MSGPAPKAANQRRRRNTVSTTKTLVAVTPGTFVTPALPARVADPETGEIEPWHPAALEFWDSLWNSPMVSEYDRSDFSGLLIIADLTHDYWAGKRGMTKKEIAAEIRLQRREYGLGPMSRRSLQWTIAQVDEATDKAAERRRAKVNRSGGPEDPRLQVMTSA